MYEVEKEGQCITENPGYAANDRTLSVVVEYQVVSNSYSVRVKTKEDHEEDDPMPHTPWLDLLVCKYDDYNWISCQSSTDSSDENESEGSDEELHEELGGETPLSDESEQFKEYFALKGSSYHKD
ncbi:hypothetical protein ACROYT_G014487 [Oculina patagonica]